MKLRQTAHAWDTGLKFKNITKKNNEEKQPEEKTMKFYRHVLLETQFGKSKHREQPVN